MINSYLTSLIFSKEILISTGLSLAILLTVCWYLFKDRSSSLVSKLFFGTTLTLVLDLLVLFISYFLVLSILKSFSIQYLVVSILFALFYYINLIINITVDIKNALFKGKNTGKLNEALKSIKENTSSRVTSLAVILFILLISVIAVGNGRINVLVILLFISGVIPTLSSLYILPSFLKLSEKVFK
jgi:hypothetical protein